MCRGRVIIRKVGGITDSGIEGLGCTGTMIIGRSIFFCSQAATDLEDSGSP